MIINLALLSWPVVTLIMALRLYWPYALIISIIGGYLFLPHEGGINLPLLPAFTKATIPCLSLLVLALLLRPGQSPRHIPREGQNFVTLNGWLPRNPIATLLLVMIIAGAIMTALTNGDRISFAVGNVTIPGLRLYEGFSIIVNLTAVIVPLLLGRKYLAHPDMHRLLLLGLAIAGLGYSLLALYEIRMSPQLSSMIYGYFPHDWRQHIRAGGWRPVVFLHHGLFLALFFAMATIAAFGLSRIELKYRGRFLLAGGWILATLLLSNSLGAQLIALLLVPVALVFSVRLQLLMAGAIAGAVLTYPVLRSADLVPIEQMVSLAAEIDERRSRSLGFRFRHEDELLDRALERPLFGWGGFGRSRIYDETGRDLSTTDGEWVITIGQGGWVRYLGQFGLLAIPLLLFALRARVYETGMATSVLCLVLAANMIDLIPNSGQTPITWLIAGALMGRIEMGRSAAPSQTPAAMAAAHRRERPPPIGPAAVARTEDTAPDLTETRAPSPYTRQTHRHTRAPSPRRS